jgi:ATP-dependent helicase HrpB
MRWLDGPPEASVVAARAALQALGALDDEGRIAPRGEQIASLPMHPVQAAMVLAGAEAGQAVSAARLALLLQERGLGGRGEDLLQRISRWDADNSPRAKASRKLADGWARQARALRSARPEPVEGRRVREARGSTGSPRAEQENPAIFLALARPDFVARRRDASGENWIAAGGRGFMLDPTSPLARAEWLAIGDAQGQAKGARITAAAVLTEREVEQALAHRIEKRSVPHWNAGQRRVEARLERRLGAITMASGPDPSPDPDAVAALLAEKAREDLPGILPAELLARAGYAGLAELSPERLAGSVDGWLLPLLHGRRDLDLPKGALIEALLNLLDWDTRQRLDRLAPREFTSPAGTTHRIDYAGDDAPGVELRVQALFGLDAQPVIGDTPLLLRLTSPAGRPIQSTRDLPAFWRGSWQDVKKDMKGRYPKHRWPDEPWAEKPSLKTKNAFEKR